MTRKQCQRRRQHLQRSGQIPCQWRRAPSLLIWAGFMSGNAWCCNFQHPTHRPTVFPGSSMDMSYVICDCRGFRQMIKSKLCLECFWERKLFCARRQKNRLLSQAVSRHHLDFQKHLRPRTFCFTLSFFWFSNLQDMLAWRDSEIDRGSRF